jgi:hypothetical protein
MRGGRYIGSGSDGCVFNSRFDASGNVLPESKDGGQGIASKVYVSGSDGGLNRQAANEYAIMMKVRAATNGLGVAVAFDGTLRSIPDIDPTERASIQKSAGGACANLTESAKPYTVIELPLVKGHMLPLSGGYAEESFTILESAVMKIQAAKVTQLDLAVRNIFYDYDDGGKTTLLLGDFGNGIDLSSDSPDELIKGFVRFVKHYKASSPTTLASRDGIHYRGYLYMIAAVFCFAAKSKPSEQGQVFWKSVKSEFALFKDSFEATVGKWRLMNMLNLFTPEPVRLSQINSKELDDVLQELENLGPDPLPAAVPPSNSSSAPEAGVPGGEIPVGGEFIADEEYSSERKDFIEKWFGDIKKTCDEIASLGEDPTAVFKTLVMDTREEVLKSDKLMYEFMRAMFVVGPVKARFQRLIAAWFPATGGKGTRRGTYRRKQGKRVKMSRRR